jgi:hypothetical protein
MKAGVDGAENDTFKILGGRRMSKASHLNVLVVDIGGTHIKVLSAGQAQRREVLSRPPLMPKEMVSGVKRLVKDWKYDSEQAGDGTLAPP